MNIIILIKLHFFEKKVLEWMMNMKNIIIKIFIGIFAVAIISATSIFIYTKYFQGVPDREETIVETSKPIQKDNKDEKVEDTVDSLKDEIVDKDTTQGTTFSFTDGQFLAIGYVPDMHLEKFIKKNFKNKAEYEKLSVHDLRNEDKREDGDRFVIIPQNSSVKIKVNTCFINDQGEVELDDTLLSDTVGGFVFVDDCMPESTTPKLCIHIEYDGFEDIVPIVFSGKDGKLDLAGHEIEVKDISVYE